MMTQAQRFAVAIDEAIRHAPNDSVRVALQRAKDDAAAVAPSAPSV